jgi:hypothetical protein
MSHIAEKKEVANKTKRIVILNKYIARALEAEGHDVEQVAGACQSAVNDVAGVLGDAKISSIKHTNKAKSHARWRENIPVTYEVKAGNAYDFLCWHDAIAEVFEKHGEPVGEITADLIPASLVMWLSVMKKRREEKQKAKKEGERNASPKAGKSGKSRIPSTPSAEPAKA